jgi:hypothetical protein
MSTLSLEDAQHAIRARTRTDRETGCWLWTGVTDSGGYGQMDWRTQGKRHRGAHRVAYAAFCADPGDLVVAQRCHRPRCCAPAHLWSGTRQEVHDAKVAAGTANNPRGDRMGTRKLRARDIPAIRARLEAGERQHAIAAAYGVSDAAISYIKNRTTWAHIP